MYRKEQQEYIGILNQRNNMYIAISKTQYVVRKFVDALFHTHSKDYDSARLYPVIGLLRHRPHY